MVGICAIQKPAYRDTKVVLDHMPICLVGWNCYDFDNACVRYWCRDDLKNLFSISRMGTFGKPSYGSILNIPGVYNVGLMVYMNKSLYKLPRYRLGDFAKYMGVTQKMKMPEMSNTVDQEVLRTYNLNDCVVAMDICNPTILVQQKSRISCAVLSALAGV